MKRRLMQFFVALGLLLTLAVIALTVRSYWAREELRFERRWTNGAGRDYDELASLNALGGRFTLYWSRYDVLDTAALFKDDEFPRPGVRVRRRTHTATPRSVYSPGAGTLPARLGFGVIGDLGGDVDDQFEFGLSTPAWFVVLVLATLTVPPWLTLRRATRRRRRAARGECVTCGYDLRGADHERCPECGAGVSAAAVQ